MRDMLTSSLRGDIGVEMEFDADLWQVEVDAGEMELAIVNLCVNARDAMPAGGIITISADNMGAEDERSVPADFVRISSVQRISSAGLRRIAPAGIALATAEGLQAHADSLRIRIAQASRPRS